MCCNSDNVIFIPEFRVIIIRADDVVRRRGYCDHFVTMCVCVWIGGWVAVYVSTIKRKPLIGMT